MKKLLFLLVAFIMVTHARAQEIDNEQWTVITKRTATWCTFCGSYGWSMFEGLQEEFTEEDDVLLIAAHYSGDLQNQAATDIVANFGGSGQPTFFLNNDNMNVNSSNVNAKIQEARQTVDLLNSFDPFAGIGLTAITYDNNEVEVMASVQFNTDLEGEFYLGVYEMNDNIVANQASQGPNTLHKRVLTRQLVGDGSSFGEMIVSGPVSNGDRIDLNTSYNFSNSDAETSNVAAILWNKVGNEYIVFNATQSDIAVSVHTSEPAFVENFSAYPSADQIVVNVSSSKMVENIELTLVGSDGKQLVSQSGTLESGENTFYIPANQLPSGIYYISIRTGNYVKTDKIFKR